nr:hypothetical protein [Brevibacillus massiliensis]
MDHVSDMQLFHGNQIMIANDAKRLYMKKVLALPKSLSDGLLPLSVWPCPGSLILFVCAKVAVDPISAVVPLFANAADSQSLFHRKGPQKCSVYY